MLSLDAEDAQTSQSVDLWSSILNSVQSSKSITTRNLVLLGEPKSGKSTLASSIASSSPTGLVSGTAHTKKPEGVHDLGLSYAYFDVGEDKDKDETVARVGVYTLQSSQPAYTSLLPLAFSEPNGGQQQQQKQPTLADKSVDPTGGLPKASIEALKQSLVVVLLDWEQPWTFLEQLRNWLSILHSLVDTASDQGLTSDSSANAKWSRARVAFDEMRERLALSLRSYVEPASETSVATQHGSLATTSLSVQLDGEEATALTEGMLTDNWGIPFVIVCTKADAIPRLERDKDFKEEQFDYIQQVLRTVCMKYGAGLFYASSQRPQSMEVVRSYLLHRLFDRSTAQEGSAAFPFSYRASTTDRDTLLVPAGWDSWGKIKALRDPFDCKATGRGWQFDCQLDLLRQSRHLPKTQQVEEQVERELRQEGNSGQETLSAMKLYEDIVSDWQAGATGREQTNQIKLPDEQAFLSLHHAATQQKDADPRAKFSKAGVVGPMSASSRGLPSVEKLMSRPTAESIQDSGGVTPSSRPGGTASRMDSTPVMSSKRDHTAAAAAAAVAGINEKSSRPSSPAVSPGAPKQSEVLHSFFQSLLKDKGSSATASPKSADRLNKPSSRPTP